ncbi:hypothetical protein A2U01_0065877, partial [Trifolium medium]|nr:hypothetical protein [Trifolium medium]
IMVDAKPIKEPKLKVDVKSNKQPKVDAKMIKEPKVDVAPNVYFRVQFTTGRKFDTRVEMIA